MVIMMNFKCILFYFSRCTYRCQYWSRRMQLQRLFITGCNFVSIIFLHFKRICDKRFHVVEFIFRRLRLEKSKMAAGSRSSGSSLQTSSCVLRLFCRIFGDIGNGNLLQYLRYYRLWQTSSAARCAAEFLRIRSLA